MSWILGDRVQHQASEGQDTRPQIWHLGKLNREAKRTFAESRSEKFSLTPGHQPFFPEAGQNTPMWNFLSPDHRDDVLITRVKELRTTGSIRTHPVKLTLIFLVPSLPLTSPSPNPCVCQFFTHLLLLCLKGARAVCSSHLCWPSWSCEAPTKTINPFCLLFSCSSVFVNFQTQPGTLRGWRKTFSSLAALWGRGWGVRKTHPIFLALVKTDLCWEAAQDCAWLGEPERGLWNM